MDATFSPDGKWIAYSSNESGTDEIFVRPFPGPGGKWRVSTGSGKFPSWSRATRELFYLSMVDGRIMVANYMVLGDSFDAAKPQVWSDRPVLQPNFIRVLDLHPEGQRFAVFPRPEIEELKDNLHVSFLLNFFDELHRGCRRESPPTSPRPGTCLVPTKEQGADHVLGEDSAHEATRSHGGKT